jgi:hypothetical protein
VSRVYASLPLTGPAAKLGRDVVRGAVLAHEQRDGDVELVLLDGFGQDRDEQAVAPAGDRRPEGARLPRRLPLLAGARNRPLLGEAGLLAVAPVATFAGLSGPTLVRLMPHDGIGARAIAAWLVEARVRELLVIHDHDEDYGVSVGAMCVEEARARGLVVRSRPVWNYDEPAADDLGEAGPVLYVGVAGSGAIGLWRDLHAHDRSMWLLGSEGVAEDWLARELSASAAERTRFFVAQRGPFALYGYEAMALALDSIGAGGDRVGTAPWPVRRAIATRFSAATRSTKRATLRPPTMVAWRSSTARSSGTARRPTSCPARGRTRAPPGWCT